MRNRHPAPQRRQSSLQVRLNTFLLGILATSLHAAALDPAFIKANGFDLRKNGGTGEVTYLRGVNLGGWLAQESWMCPTSLTNPTAGLLLENNVEQQLLTRFGSAVTKNSLIDTYQANWITAADLDAIQAMGMNFIRVPFSHLLFAEEQPSSVAINNVVWKSDAVAFKYLDWIVTQAGNRGIYVLLDFHQVEGGAGDPTPNGVTNPNAFWNNPAYQDRAVVIWQKIATRYVGNPWVVGYDLLNEPWSTAISYYDRCLKAIRPIDPDHAIFMETWGWNNLPTLATYAWSNVVCSVHYYPSYADTSASTINATLAQYTGGLRSIRDQQQASGKYVPIHIGEFYLGAANMAQWRSFVSSLGDVGVAWTKWTFKTNYVSGWGTYQRGADPADPLNQATYTPDLFAAGTDAAAVTDIQTKWTRWKTPSHTAGNWDHLDSSNRKYSASPIATGETRTVPTSGTLVVLDSDLLGNDTSLNPDAALEIIQRSNPAHGTWYPINGGKVYVVNTGYTGTDTATYRVRDQVLNLPSAAIATLSLTVNQATTAIAPYSFNDAYTTHLNSPLTVMADGVLINDGDVLGRNLSATKLTDPTHGTVTFAANGAFRYVPTSGFTGTDSFTYTAQAGGTSSAPATVIITVTAPDPTNGGGLSGGYANGNGFPTPLATRIDPTIAFTWDGVNAPITGVNATNFCVRWIGKLCPPVTGTYTLTTTSDDAIRVYVGNPATLLIDDWGAHGAQDKSATIALTGGQPLDLRIDYVQYGGGGAARLTWTPPAGAAETVPSSAFVPGTTTPNYPPPAEVVVQGKPPVPSAPAITNNGTTSPMLSGATLPGVVVTIFNDATGDVLATATADAQGAWQWNVVGLSAGSYALSVVATNTVINASSGHSAAATVSITAPPALPGGGGSSACGFGSGLTAWFLVLLGLAQLSRKQRREP